jgi:hypothetical protein
MFVLTDNAKIKVKCLKASLVLLLTNYVLFYLNISQLTKEEKNNLSKAFANKFKNIENNEKQILDKTFEELSSFNVKHAGCPYLNSKEYPNCEYCLYIWIRAFDEY